MATTQQQLTRAFELIKRDELDEAMTILRPITQAEPENVDAWWLTANAASEPRDARRALVNVLRINPNYSKADDARTLLEKLNELYPPRDDELMALADLEDRMESHQPITATPPRESNPFDNDLEDFFKNDDDDLFSSDNDFELFDEDEDDQRGKQEARAPKRPTNPPDFDSDDDFTSLDDDDPFAALLEEDGEGRRSGRRSPLRLLVLLLLIPLLLVAVFFLFLRGGGDDPAAEVPVVVDPGALAPADMNALAPDNASNLELIRTSTEAEAQGLFGGEATALFVQEEAGVALVVRICTQPGPQVRQLALDGIDLAARRGTTPDIRASLALVGVSVEDCANNDTLYRAVAPVSEAIAFTDNRANYRSALSAFQASWVVRN